MGNLSLFFPITKVDATQRLVYGIATAEVQDRGGEICDYASTKPHYERWSEEIAQSTGGKSLGNLRSMHGLVAAGKITEINFNDVDRQIEICAKVVDDLEWTKVTEGVYTGFSQGGVYERRWTDEHGLTHYTAVPTEISLVDLPCLPQSRFEMIKVDGTREMRTFESRPSVVDRLEDIRHALESLDGLSSHDLDQVPDLGALIEDIHNLAMRLGPIVDRMGLATHSSLPWRAIPDTSAEKVAGTGGVYGPRFQHHDGSGLRFYSDRRESRRQYRDSAVGLDADSRADRLLKSGLEKRIDTLGLMLEDVLKRVKNIEQQPLPLPLSGRTQVISKDEDGLAEVRASAGIDSLLRDPEGLSLLAIRLAQRNGHVRSR